MCHDSPITTYMNRELSLILCKTKSTGFIQESCLVQFATNEPYLIKADVFFKKKISIIKIMKSRSKKIYFNELFKLKEL